MSMHRLPLLAQRVLNTPLMIHPGKAEVILHALGERFGVNTIAPGAFASWDDDADDQAPEPKSPWLTGYQLVDGAAIIAVEGTLVHKNGGAMRPYSGMTGYDGLSAALRNALADDAVGGIVLEVDSYGGEVSGCFDLADEIYAARGSKPIHAILTETACSAAYALASAADRIVIPRTGICGSIGVIAVMVEMSQMMKREGVTANIIQFGARKADGNPFQALPPEARARFQAQIDHVGDLFVSTVARNRRIAAKAVRNTEAGCFTAEEALELGLVDAILPPQAAFEQLLAEIN